MTDQTVEENRGVIVRRDTMDTSYALKEGDMARVQCGDAVAAGDLIATGPGAPAIIAYAATLHLSEDAAAGEIARYEGMSCKAGTSLGTRRVGLVTRNVRASANCLMRGLPQSGAFVIRDTRAEFPQYARYGGIVRAISRRELVIRSEVARCGYAFADTIHTIGPLRFDPALLDSAVTEPAILRTPTASASMIVAHIADTAHLKAVIRSFHGTLVVGSVTESVAWALLEHSQASESRNAKESGIIVLSGIGDVQDGTRAIAPFRRFPSAYLARDRFTHTLTVIPSDGILPASELDSCTDHRESTFASF